MSDNLEGFLTTKQAAKLTGYTKDYVGQLARQGHIGTKKVGRARMVKINDLFDYVQAREAEKAAASSDNTTETTTETSIKAVEVTSTNTKPTEPAQTETTPEDNEPEPVEVPAIEKKIVSPWVDPAKVNKPTRVSAIQPEFSSKNYSYTGAMAPAQSSTPSRLLPMISSSVVALAALVMMFALGAVVYDRAELASIDTSASYAAVGELDTLQKIGYGWFKTVSQYLR